MANIKKINVDQVYEIEALHFIANSTLDTPAQWKSYIDTIAADAAKIKLVIDSWNTAGTAPATTASASTLGKIYLVPAASGKPSPESGSYVEFITIESGSSTKTYSWEKIGTTDTDLSEYAKKGTYTTSDGGAGTTGEADLGTATGTASGNYLKPDADTGNAGGTATANTGNAGAATVTGNAQVVYDKAASQTGSSGAHTHSVTGTVSYSSGTAATKQGVKVSTTACGDSEKGTVGLTAASLGTASTTTVVTGVTAASASGTTVAVTGITGFSGGSATGSFNTDAVKASVADGVLTLAAASKSNVGWTPASLGTLATATVVTGVTGGTASGTSSAVTGYPNFSGGALIGTTTFITSAIKGAALAADNATTPAFAFNTDAIKEITGLSFTGGEAASAGAHTHSVGSSTATASGTATVTLANHSHTYVELKQHSHSVTTTKTAITDGACSVSIGKHTHSVSNHTHNVTI